MPSLPYYDQLQDYEIVIAIDLKFIHFFRARQNLRELLPFA